MAAATPAKKAAPRKRTPAARKDNVVPGVPATGVPVGAVEPVEPEQEFDGFDLDALDKKDVLPNVTDQPFRFKLTGRWFQMGDPRDVDWKDVLDGLNNPIMFMRLAMDDPEEADDFIAIKLPGWKLSALFDNWQEHFGVDGLTDLNKLLSGRAGPRTAD